MTKDVGAPLKQTGSHADAPSPEGLGPSGFDPSRGPELGNLIFGNSRGEFPVDRGMQDEWCSLMEECGFDGYGHHDGPEWVFENDVFRVQPYYWGDCTCGYEQREDAWSEANAHRSHCYQERKKSLPLNRYRPQIDAAVEERNKHDWRTDAERGAQAEVDRLSDLERKHRDRLLRGLCKELGIPWDGGRGCMVHCTCDYQERWAAFLAENAHASDCPIVTPNFLHKPTGFRLDWYKYALRDSYSSAPLTRKLMRSMWADCFTSLSRDTDGSPKGRDAQQLDGAAATAGAGTASPNLSSPPPNPTEKEA